MSLDLVITIDGIPAPQGSKRAFVVNGKPVMVEDNTRTKPWRTLVHDAAVDAMGGRPPTREPVMVNATFTFPWRKGDLRRDGSIKPSAPHWKTSAPDVDKLLRAVLDAITGVVFVDDSQVVDITADRPYGSLPGLHLYVKTVDNTIVKGQYVEHDFATGKF